MWCATRPLSRSHTAASVGSAHGTGGADGVDGGAPIESYGRKLSMLSACTGCMCLSVCPRAQLESVCACVLVRMATTAAAMAAAATAATALAEDRSRFCSHDPTVILGTAAASIATKRKYTGWREYCTVMFYT